MLSSRVLGGRTGAGSPRLRPMTSEAWRSESAAAVQRPSEFKGCWPRPLHTCCATIATQGQIPYHQKRRTSSQARADRCCCINHNSRTKQATRSPSPALADTHPSTTRPPPSLPNTTIMSEAYERERCVTAPLPNPTPKDPLSLRSLPDKTTTPSPPSAPKSPPCAA